MIDDEFLKLQVGGKLRRIREDRGPFGGGFSEYLRIGFRRNISQQVIDPSWFEFMTEVGSQYAVNFGSEENIFLSLDIPSGSTLFKKKFNAEASGSYEGEFNYTKGSWMELGFVGDLNAAGTTLGTGTVLDCQLCEIESVTVGVDEAIVAPHCDNATGEANTGMTFIVTNVAPTNAECTASQIPYQCCAGVGIGACVAGDAKLFPPDAAGNMGAGVGSPITLFQDASCVCSCIQSDEYRCSCASYQQI